MSFYIDAKQMEYLGKKAPILTISYKIYTFNKKW